MSADVGGPSLVPEFGPLHGVRVLDSGRFVAGPWAASHLAEFGAQVVHVETSPFGYPYSDRTRTLPPLIPDGAPPERSVSESWVQYSRNKLSLGLDVSTPAGRDVFLDLAARSDIWIESSRPGTYARLGLPDDLLWKRNRRLTIVHVSGFGQYGVPERVRQPSFDLVGQAFSGYLSLQGNPDPEPPMRSGTALNDTVTGLAGAAAALMGYISVQRTGIGQAVDVAQYEVFFTLLENMALDYFVRGTVRTRQGRFHPRLFPYNVYRASDGWVVVAAPTQEMWVRLAGLLGPVPSEWNEPRMRSEHREEVDARIAEFCRSRTSLELEALGRQADVAVSRVMGMAEIASDAHYQARDMFVDWTDPVAGPVRGPGIAPKFSGTPGRVWRGAPTLGQDNDVILRSLLGYDASRIHQLVASGVVGTASPGGTSAPSAPRSMAEKDT